MGLFKKKPDLVEERARAVQAELASLKAKIRKLSAAAAAAPGETMPKLRSTAWPQGAGVPAANMDDSPSSAPAGPPPPASPPGGHEPVFEAVNQSPLHPPAEPPPPAQLYNELGLRKYDLATLLRRAQIHFKSKPVTNPKLVNYLAAGSIHGLRPLRYEKRIARNRFIFLAVILGLAIYGLGVMLLRWG
jgi:hypothetical protein